VTDKEQYELLKIRKMSQDYYRIKGEGRPTKKDRSDMDDYVENDVASDFTDWDDFFGETGEDDSKPKIDIIKK
jgi:ribosome-associated heat shock protein Hsp15